MDEMTTDLKNHPWFEMLRDTIKILNPELYDGLNNSGKLDEYLITKLTRGIDIYDNLLFEGSDEQAAKEAALRYLMDSEETEEFEEGIEETSSDPIMMAEEIFSASYRMSTKQKSTKGQSITWDNRMPGACKPRK